MDILLLVFAWLAWYAGTKIVAGVFAATWIMLNWKDLKALVRK